MLLHHCVNLNIAKDSGHLFEDDGQEIGKAKKRVPSRIRATEPLIQKNVI